MLAGILGSDVGFEICGLGFLIALFATYVCACYLLCQEVKRKLGTPVGWRDAQARYPLPDTIQGPRIRRGQFVKSTARRWHFYCELQFDRDGVLLKDGNPARLFSFGGMYCPWGALEHPQAIRLPWYLSLRRAVAVELTIQRTKLSLIVTKDVWIEHLAPHIAHAAENVEPGTPPDAGEPGSVHRSVGDG